MKVWDDYDWYTGTIAGNTCGVHNIYTKSNPADILSKNLPAGENRYRNVRMVLFDIYPKIEE